jgi:hypothetical protein
MIHNRELSYFKTFRRAICHCATQSFRNKMIHKPISRYTSQINTDSCSTVQNLSGGRDSAVGIATHYGLNGREFGVGVPMGVKDFLFSTSSRPAPGFTQPSIQWVPGLKRPEREADYSPPTSIEVKKMWIIHPLPIRLHGVVFN